MKDTLRVLGQYPELGITSSVGSGVIHWLGVLNPILSFISLVIGKYRINDNIYEIKRR